MSHFYAFVIEAIEKIFSCPSDDENDVVIGTRFKTDGFHSLSKSIEQILKFSHVMLVIWLSM